MPTSRSEIEAGVVAILAKYTAHRSQPIRPDDHIVRDLGVDGDEASFLLVPEIEARFGIAPPIEAWSRAATVRDICQLVASHQDADPRDVAADRARRSAYQRRALTVLCLMVSVGLILCWLQPAFGVLWFAGSVLAAYVALAFMWWVSRWRERRLKVSEWRAGV